MTELLELLACSFWEEPRITRRWKSSSAKCLAVDPENCSQLAPILLSFAEQTQPTSLYAFSPWTVMIEERCSVKNSPTREKYKQFLILWCPRPVHLFTTHIESCLYSSLTLKHFYVYFIRAKNLIHVFRKCQFICRYNVSVCDLPDVTLQANCLNYQHNSLDEQQGFLTGSRFTSSN